MGVVHVDGYNVFSKSSQSNLLLLQDAHLVQSGGVRIWEATVPGVELRPRHGLNIFNSHFVMRGLTLNVSSRRS